MSGDTFYCHSCVWGCHLYLVGRSKGCCLTPYSAQDSLPQQRTILPKTSRVQTLRNKPFADIRNSPSIISTQEYNSHQQHIFLQWSGSCAKEGNKEKFPQSRMLGSSFGTYVQVGLHPTQRVKRLAESVKTGHWCDRSQSSGQRFLLCYNKKTYDLRIHQNQPICNVNIYFIRINHSCIHYSKALLHIQSANQNVLTLGSLSQDSLNLCRALSCILE